MALYVYAPVLNDDAAQLLEALDAKRLRRFDGMRFVNKGMPILFDEKEDTIVCWGAHVPPIGKLRIFNKSLEFANRLILNTNLRKIPFKKAGWHLAEMNPCPNAREREGHYYASDPEWGNVVSQPDFPGYAQPLYTGKVEYHVTMLGTEAGTASEKVPTLKQYNPDFTTYNPEKHAHKWYRTPKTGWKSSKIEPNSIPTVCSVAKGLMEATELDFAVIHFLCTNTDAYNPGGFGSSIVRKIDTAPALDTPDKLAFVVSAIKTWIVNNGGKP